MCLSLIDIKKTKQLQKKPGTFIAYKVYKLRNGELSPPYQKGVITRPGTIVAKKWISTGTCGVFINATRPLTKQEIKSREVSYGIHVFSTKRGAGAICNLGGYTFPRVIVPVVCHYKNVRAIGKFKRFSGAKGAQSIVLTKIEITQEDWDKAVKGDTQCAS